MEMEIIGQIAEAEREAAERKAQAAVRAAQIVAAAEQRAAELLASSETELRLDRETALKDATECAESEYENTIKSCRAQAEKYADDLLKGLDNYVTQIVGRLTK